MATTIQGDFTNQEQAAQAKAKMIEMGIAPARIRIWNIIPDTDATPRTGSGATTGALLGGAVAGGTGFAVGAIIGGVLGDADKHLPLPAGVRIVIDVEGNEEQVRATLLATGAAHVQTKSGTS